jgi:hypothetical protein
LTCSSSHEALRQQLAHAFEHVLRPAGQRLLRPLLATGRARADAEAQATWLRERLPAIKKKPAPAEA